MGPSTALKSTAEEPRRRRRGLRPGSGHWVGSRSPFPSTSEQCQGHRLASFSLASTLLPIPGICREGPVLLAPQARPPRGQAQMPVSRAESLRSMHSLPAVREGETVPSERVPGCPLPLPGAQQY